MDLNTLFIRQYRASFVNAFQKNYLEGIIVSSHSILIGCGIDGCSIEEYRIVSSLYHRADADILHIPPRRICVPKYSFSQLIGNDLINLLLRVIVLIHALGQYADAKNHDDDGRHQDNKKNHAGFIIFELRKHIL